MFLVRVCGGWKYKIFWTEFYQIFPAFIQLCFLNENLTFSIRPEYMKFSCDFRSRIIYFDSEMFYDLGNKYHVMNSYLQYLIRARHMMFYGEIFTGNILRNKPTKQRSLPMSLSTPHWWWCHCMCMIPITALTPEIQTYIITEQKCFERQHLFNFFIRSVIANIQGVLQICSKQRRLLTGLT
jgi:hypothetical protein